MQKLPASFLSPTFICLSLMVNGLSLPADSKTETAKIAKQYRREGEALFRANGCFDCHSINGRGSTEGVSLSSVGLRRNKQFLEEQLLDPEKHVRNNKKAFNSEPNLMTDPNLSRKEAALIVTYLQSLKKPVPRRGQRSKDYNTL
jgi:mono/diheme cytochrome c family protein